MNKVYSLHTKFQKCLLPFVCVLCTVYIHYTLYTVRIYGICYGRLILGVLLHKITLYRYLFSIVIFIIVYMYTYIMYTFIYIDIYILICTGNVYTYI